MCKTKPPRRPVFAAEVTFDTLAGLPPPETLGIVILSKVASTEAKNMVWVAEHRRKCQCP